jgi:hypothetical protein
LSWKRLGLDRGDSKEKLVVCTNLEFSVSGRYIEKTRRLGKGSSIGFGAQTVGDIVGR